MTTFQNPTNNDITTALVVAPSKKHLTLLQDAIDILEQFGVSHKQMIMAAHRAPKNGLDFLSNIDKQSIKIIIAGASGAAHLPGFIASLTNLPVIGVPLHFGFLQGLDSTLSMLQMPKGVPVGTMGIDSAYNAGIYACQILALTDNVLREKLKQFKTTLEKSVISDNNTLQETNKH